MRFNTLGSAAMGNGNGSISVDGATPAPLVGIDTSKPRWLNDDTLIFEVSQLNYGALTPGLSTIDLNSLAITVIQADGSNRLAAGGDVWANFLSIGDGYVDTSYLTTYAGAGLGDIGEDGSLVTLTNYLTGGLTSYSSTGVQRWAETVALRFDSPTPVRSGYVAYCDANAGWVIRDVVTGLVQPYFARTELPIAVVPFVRANGDLWVCEQIQSEGNWLTIRKATESKGFTLIDGDPTFTPDVRVLASGIVRVGWSHDVIETPTALEMTDISLTTGETVDGVVSGGMVVWTLGPTLAEEALPTVPGTGLVEGQQFVSNLVPVNEPFLGKDNRVSRHWLDYFVSLSQGNADSKVFRESVPKTVVLPAFRTIRSGENTPLYADEPGDVEFTGSGVGIVIDPVTKQVQLTATASGGGSGIPGDVGDDGEDGVPGQMGPMGPQGPAGPTGSSGEGVPGPMGPDGDEGEMFMLPGPKGDTGSTGATGPAGASGTVVGMPGLDGDDGESFVIGPSRNQQSAVVGFVIDGGGTTLTTGVKGFLQIPFSCTILGWTILSTDAAVTSGSIVIDVWKDVLANYPPTVADTITASAKPTLTTATNATSTTLTGWNTSIFVGDVLGFNVDSVSSVTRITLELQVVKA